MQLFCISLKKKQKHAFFEKKNKKTVYKTKKKHLNRNLDNLATEEIQLRSLSVSSFEIFRSKKLGCQRFNIVLAYAEVKAWYDSLHGDMF